MSVEEHIQALRQEAVDALNRGQHGLHNRLQVLAEGIETAVSEALKRLSGGIIAPAEATRADQPPVETPEKGEPVEPSPAEVPAPVVEVPAPEPAPVVAEPAPEPEPGPEPAPEPVVEEAPAEPEPAPAANGKGK